MGKSSKNKEGMPSRRWGRNHINKGEKKMNETKPSCRWGREKMI
jgi:hypothetical protein